MAVEKPREIAARVLVRRLTAREPVEDLLERELSSAALSGADRGLCQELVYGVARRQRTLDWLITRKTQGRTQKDKLRVLLQLGLYQMFWLDRIPDHATVHETVEMAKRQGLGPQAGFVNAVLRGYTREQEQTAKLLKELQATEPALGFSHPDWLYERWSARWGAEKTARLMEWNNMPPPTFARVNTLKTDAGTLLKRWKAEGVKTEACDFDWSANDLVFRLISHPPLAGLASFSEGLFYIQDPSTVLAVRELAVEPGQTVLDLCAAPGGKTTLIAQLMQNRGRIVARDNDAGRLKIVRENCDRLGVTCVETEGAGRKPDAPAQFDRILVDAPCSNTGVMRRRVELRWRVTAAEIERLRKVQLELLRQAALELKPEGVLVYSTCSLEPEENAKVVEQFLSEHPKFTLSKEREFTPFNDGVDGAYVAKLSVVSGQ
jgi:16S rRNA (cytosine967-C5)-methyltransferase